MDWLETAAGLGAVGITAVVLVIVGKILLKISDSLLNRSSETPALLAIMNRQLDQNGEQLTEMRELRKDEQTRENHAHARHEAILQAFRGLITGATTTTTEVKNLTSQIGILGTIMTEHTSATPTIEDVLAEIKLLRDELRDAVTTFTIKVATVEDRIKPIEAKVEQIKNTTPDKDKQHDIPNATEK